MIHSISEINLTMLFNKSIKICNAVRFRTSGKPPTLFRSHCTKSLWFENHRISGAWTLKIVVYNRVCVNDADKCLLRIVIAIAVMSNERHGISNHRQFDCLFSRLLNITTKTILNLRIPALGWGNPPVICVYSSLRNSHAENVSMSSWANELCDMSSNFSTLLWRHNGSDGVSNHQPHECLLNHPFSRR